MELGIRGKHALVLGAAGGLGSSVAAELASEGARLLLSDKDQSRLLDVAGELETRFPVRIVTGACDLLAAEQVAALADRDIPDERASELQHGSDLPGRWRNDPLGPGDIV